MLYIDKSPTDESKWLSVEIECIMPTQRALNQFESDIKTNGLRKFVTSKTDGSLRGSDHDDDCACECHENDDRCDDCANFGVCREFVVTFPRSHENILEVVCLLLNHHGATVNKSCGLHVHFDMRNVARSKVLKYGNSVAKAIPLLKSMLPKSRRDNQFCQTDINEFGNRGSRYSFVNLKSFSKHNTLEIRGHSGTTEATKIINWIKLLELLMNQNTENFVIDTLDKLSEVCNVPENLFYYIESRLKKFNPVLGSVIDHQDQVTDVAA